MTLCVNFFIYIYTVCIYGIYIFNYRYDNGAT